MSKRIGVIFLGTILLTTLHCMDVNSVSKSTCVPPKEAVAIDTNWVNWSTRKYEQFFSADTVARFTIIKDRKTNDTLAVIRISPDSSVIEICEIREVQMDSKTRKDASIALLLKKLSKQIKREKDIQYLYYVSNRTIYSNGKGVIEKEEQTFEDVGAILKDGSSVDLVLANE